MYEISDWRLPMYSVRVAFIEYSSASGSVHIARFVNWHSSFSVSKKWLIENIFLGYLSSPKLFSHLSTLPVVRASYGSAFSLVPPIDLAVTNIRAFSTSSDFRNVSNAYLDSCSPSILTVRRRHDFLNSSNRFQRYSRNESSWKC